jgi:heme/copper-type cytochrome/quinol oxidase subunit 2
MNILLIVFALFIAVVGFMAARYYQQSTAENAAKRAAYANFAAYVFGVAPILILLLSMGADMLSKRDPTRVMRARLHFGLYAMMAIFAIALSAMLINDLRDDEARNTTFKHHYTMSIVVLVISIVLLIYASVVAAMPNKYADKFNMVTGFEDSFGSPMAGFGSYDDINDINGVDDDDMYPQLFGFGRSRAGGPRRRRA